MSNVVDFRAALAALDARKTERAAYRNSGYAAAFQGFGVAPPNAVSRTPTAQALSVRVVQERLVALGFRVGVDGKNGPETSAAVRYFQTQVVGTPGTGSMDLDTWAQMQAAGPGDVAEHAAYWNANRDALIKAGGIPAATPAAGGGGSTALAPPAPVGMPAWTRNLPPSVANVVRVLIAPGKPVYQKPVVWIGAGAAALILISALTKKRG
jgi:peptidoglycan hydrolase-like protein with peptidoglycan-binding domain